MIFNVKQALIDAAVEWFGVPGKAVVAVRSMMNADEICEPRRNTKPEKEFRS